MKTDHYIAIESDKATATVEQLGPNGATVEIRFEKGKAGQPQVYVIAFGHDDRRTIVGEILSDLPQADE